MSLLNQANSEKVSESIDAQRKFVKTLKIIYPTSQVGGKEDNGKFCVGETIIGDTITVKALNIRSIVSAHKKSGNDKNKKQKADFKFIGENDLLYEGEKADNVRAFAKVENLEVRLGIDVLLYIKEIDDFAVFEFKTSTMDDFSALDALGQAIMSTYLVPNMDMAWYRTKYEPVDGDISFDEEKYQAELERYKK